jgi:hypothetical protein
MTPVKWNILAGFLADLKFTEKHCKTRTIGKERCAEIADALDAAFEKMKIRMRSSSLRFRFL